MLTAKELEEKVKYLRSVKGDLKGALKLLEGELLQHDENEKAPILYALGILYSDVGDYMRSKSNLRKAVLLAEKYNDIFIRSNALRRLGYVIWISEKNDTKALDFAEEALNIVRKYKGNKYREVEASSYALIGNVNFDLGRYDQAGKVYKKGLIVTRRIGYIERESTILGDLGNLFLRQKQYSKALTYLEQAKAIAEKKYRHELPAALLRIGYVYFDRDNKDRNINVAKKYFNNCLKVSLKDGWKKDEAEAYLALSKVEVELGNGNKAVLLKSKADRIFAKLHRGN